MSKEKVIFYSDELNDEFSGTKLDKVKTIDKNFKYIHKNIFWKISSFVLYRLIISPILWVFCKLKFRYRIKNKSVIKKYKKTGYFMYGNHTQNIADVSLPTIVNFPKKVYTIANADNVSMPVLGKITPMLNVLPLPDDFGATKNFLKALEIVIKKNNCVMVFPEAHIWPYYTKIRNFKSTSFKYPIKFNAPTFCLTNVYKKRKIGKKPKIVTYIDGPFYADGNLTLKEQEENLRNKVFSAMQLRSEENNYEYIKYIKKEK